MHRKALICSYKILACLALSSLSLMTACVAPHYDVRNIPSEEMGLPPLVRLHDVAFPLLVAAADWCGLDQEPAHGFLIMDIKISKELEVAYSSSSVFLASSEPIKSGFSFKAV
jgi:hypothetical protein